MGTKSKAIDPELPGVQQLLTDVREGTVSYYEPSSFPSGVVPEAYSEKCSEFVVVVSGSVTEKATWLGILPKRVDKDVVEAGGKVPKCYDVDPMIFVFEEGTSSALTSGRWLYHQKFGGRTVGISGHDYDSIETPVTHLRAQVLETSQPLQTVSSAISSGFEQAVEVLRQDI